MKKIFKKEVIIAFIIGIILASSIAVYAYSYAAKDVSYTKPGENTPISVESALNELYTNKGKTNKGEYKFINGESQGFTLVSGDVDLKSYGLTSKSFPTTNNGFNYVKYQKQVTNTLKSKFELSGQIYFNNESTSYMGHIRITLFNNNQEKLLFDIGDDWSDRSAFAYYAAVDNTTIYSAGTYNDTRYNISGRYAIISDGSKLYFYWGSKLMGSIDYNDGISYDKIEISFSKYSTYSIPNWYIESLYVGEPLYYKDFV